MGLQRRTIEKLFREDFPGTAPIVVTASERDKLAAAIKAKLERFHDLGNDRGYLRDEEKPFFVHAFTVPDNEPYYYHGSHSTFRLFLDQLGRLTIKEAYSGLTALVSDLDEIITFIEHCKERVTRQKALQTQRAKVRDLLAQAILAQVRKLAKEERFDFMSETDAQKLKLFVKLSDEHNLVIHIPFKEFKKHLPELRSVIVTLRQLYENGVRFQIVSQGALPWRGSWTTHDQL